ncbi:MAG: hypothetical protein NZ524_01455 [Thiobacillaceae bacterium]|nr:hypothetical protein [Thiobacillaceae bacterium]MCX7672895.1 hypothetical protein [Thiobacillaceae bacterium]MDW8322643.1 hypothetical protein [Burkholderiales bacterium]
MPALRILVIACALTVIIALLGYAASRDRRWLRLAGYAFKGGVAIAAAILLLTLASRLLPV